MTISIITINYHSQKYLAGFLSSHDKHLLSHAGKKYAYEIIVVNNEKNPLDLLNLYPSRDLAPKIIWPGKNLGFGVANNLAARQAKGELLFFLNPDVELKDSSLLEMFDYLADRPEIGIIGPKIMLSTPSRPQPWSCGKKCSLRSILFRNTIAKPWNKKLLTPVDWVSGTALLLRKKDFLKIGGFDENFFMYFEDQDLCLRLKNTGQKIIFFPNASLVHHDGKSWSNQKQKKLSFYQSQDYFFSKHHSPLQSWLLKILRLPIIFWLKLK